MEGEGSTLVSTQLLQLLLTSAHRHSHGIEKELLLEEVGQGQPTHLSTADSTVSTRRLLNPPIMLSILLAIELHTSASYA